MISIDKLNAEIISKVCEVYPEIEFTAQEKLEDIKRPSFKLILDEISSERYTTDMVKRTFPVELVYFAKDLIRPKLECIGVYERLEGTLLAFGDSLKSSINCSEAVLAVDFDITQIDQISVFAADDPDETGSGENMDTLELEG